MSRRWCFTSFDENETKSIISLTNKFCIVGIEICPTTKKQHYQGFINLINTIKLGGLKKIASTTHFEVSEGSDEDNLKYCSKDGNIYHKNGEPSFKGKRNDINKIADAIMEGASIQEIASDNPSAYIKYHKGINALKFIQDKTDKTEREINGLYIWGDSGVGKTRMAVDYDKNYYILSLKNQGQIWFDGYDGENTLIIDELKRGQINYGDLLRIADRYPYQAPIKGGSIMAKWKNVIITANHPMDEIFSDDYLPAMKRRFKEICLNKEEPKINKLLYTF